MTENERKGFKTDTPVRFMCLRLLVLLMDHRSCATPWTDASTASDTATAGCQGRSNHQWIALSAKTYGDRLRHVIPRSQVHAERNQSGSGRQCGCQVCLSMRSVFPCLCGTQRFLLVYIFNPSNAYYCLLEGAHS